MRILILLVILPFSHGSSQSLHEMRSEEVFLEVAKNFNNLAAEIKYKNSSKNHAVPNDAEFKFSSTLDFESHGRFLVGRIKTYEPEKTYIEISDFQFSLFCIVYEEVFKKKDYSSGLYTLSGILFSSDLNNPPLGTNSMGHILGLVDKSRDLIYISENETLVYSDLLEKTNNKAIGDQWSKAQSLLSGIFSNTIQYDLVGEKFFSDKDANIEGMDSLVLLSIRGAVLTHELSPQYCSRTNTGE